MAAKTYTVMNGAAPGAAAVAPIATNTVLKTMLQLFTLAGFSYRVVEWWTEFDGSAAATPVRVEMLYHTGGPQTTLTTYAAADIAAANDPNATASSTVFSLASNASGFGTGATEVTPTTVRNVATHLVPPTSGIYIQYPLGREPEGAANTSYLRHRTTSTTNINCYAGVTVEV